MNTAIFLLKFSACLALFLLFYKGVLERESMHHFKRFYLLAALATSFIIPTIVFTQYVDMAQQPLVQPTQTTGHIDQPGPVPPVSAEGPMNWEMALGFVYGLGVLGFGFRFLRHLAQIGWRIRHNPKRKTGFITKVLLSQNLPPHTFFRYVFLNKKQHQSHAIPPEVLLHEETHARQYHSLDVVFVELAQVLLWFHPLIYLLKSSMTLNHEFLADRAVVQQKGNIPKYQSLLLSYVAQASTNQKPSVPMANAIVHSSTRAAQSRSIKKRFTIMKTRTSKKSVVLRSALLLPLMALLFFGFSQKKIETREAGHIIKDINIEITKEGQFFINDQYTSLSNLAKKAREINKGVEPYFLKNYVHVNILYHESQYQLIPMVQGELENLGINNIIHISDRTREILNQKRFTPSIYNDKTLAEAQQIRRKKVFSEMNGFDKDGPPMEIIWLEVENEHQFLYENEKLSLTEVLEKIKETYNSQNLGANYEVQLYSKGIMNSDFLNEINNKLRELGIKRITAFSDKFILPEEDFKEHVDITPETIFLETNKIGFSKNNTSQNLRTEKSVNSKIELAGIIIDSETLQPLKGVSIYDSKGKLLSKSDQRGYYSFQFELLNHGEIFFELSLLKDGYKSLVQREHWGNLEGGISSGFYFGLQKKESSSPEFSELIADVNNFSYESFQNNLYSLKRKIEFNKKVKNVTEGNQNILFKINSHYYLINDSGWIKINSKDDLISINNDKIIQAHALNGMIKRKAVTGMTPLQNEKALFAVYTTPENIYSKRKKNAQQSATREEIEEYNTLAKKYNDMDRNQMRIKSQEVQRLKELYSKMSNKQRETAELFPDFPEPPPVPKAPKAPNKNEKHLTETIQVKKEEIVTHRISGSVPSAPKAPLAIDEEGISREMDKEIIAVQEQGKAFVAPPTPPTPPNPVDHIVAMAKKGAVFFFEGEEISSNKALKIVKEQKNLNIQSKHTNGAPPEVRLTKTFQ